ncbi:hypothetical protein K488DRAFT_67983 [Vararia minispora EC-137]|uniref:Uncharacterized protein n=1 Tax=Vararia minispora EC-137 TaxID=1314806 RepID=A0ACB8QWZ5_9AGAM|nr:hypothetical protein K488DRAFT_67983 [Vararia minispora EC-137]
MSLPSFEELLGSLRLSDDKQPVGGSIPPVPRRNIFRGHRRALSDSSSSEFDDDFELEPESPPSYRTVFSSSLLGIPLDSDVRLSRHGKRDRYSPYASVSKRVSMPSLNDEPDFATHPNRATSTSPLHSVHRVRPIRSSGHVGRTSTRSSRSGSQSSWTSPESLPISSFVRRKTPRSASSSPTASTFPAAVRDGPISPVAIPALPILLPNFLASPSTGSPSSTCSDAMEVHFDDAKPPSLIVSPVQATA